MDKKINLPIAIKKLLAEYPKIFKLSKLLEHFKIDDQFIIENPNLIKHKRDSETFFSIQKLDEKKLENLIQSGIKLNWEHICTHQKLSLSFMNKYINLLDRRVCFNQVLNLKFILNNLNKPFIDWVGISRFQLNEIKLIELDEYLLWDFVFLREDLSDDFKIRNIHKSKRFKLSYDIDKINLVEK